MSDFKKHLFLSEIYPPFSGNSSTLFAGRFVNCPADKVVVLTKCAPRSEEFDLQQDYLIVRTELPWKGPPGFEWLGVVWNLVLRGLPLCLQHRIEVIQCARPIPEGVAGWILSRLLWKKLVLNFYGEDISLWQRHRVKRMLLKHIVLAARLNIANSRYTESLIRQLEPCAETAVVYPGFFPPRLSLNPEMPQQLKHFFDGGPILLTVGSLERRKGQDNVIKSLPPLVEEFPNLRYLIVGSSQGGEKCFFEELHSLITRLELGDHVALVGEVGERDLIHFYAHCDLFVMANRREQYVDVESFSAVFFAAGYFKKPVICGKAGGSAEAIVEGETGVLVEGHDVSQITQAIFGILANPKKAKAMGEAGRERASKWTHEQMFVQYQREMSRRGL